jgi:predicted RNase H-like HicB family nuclease
MAKSLKEEGISLHKNRVAGQTFRVVLTADLEDCDFTIQWREIPGAISEGSTGQEALDTHTEVLAELLDQGQKPKARTGQAG